MNNFYLTLDLHPISTYTILKSRISNQRKKYLGLDQLTTARLRKHNIREHITKHHQKLLDVVHVLEPSDLDAPFYGNRSSSNCRVPSAIAHFTAAALGMLRNARAITTGEDPLPSHFALNRWIQSAVKNASNVPTDTFLAKLERIHQNWLNFLDKIPEAHLSHMGHHALGDVITIEGYMRRYAEHESHHANEIRLALRRRDQQPGKSN